MILIRNIARIKRVKNKLNIKGNKFKKYFIKLNKLMFELTNNFLYIYSMGIGDWGLGIGDWGLGPIPNPQSPYYICLFM